MTIRSHCGLKRPEWAKPPPFTQTMEYEQSLEEKNEEKHKFLEYVQSQEFFQKEAEKKREKKEKIQKEYEQAVKEWRKHTKEHKLHLERCAANLAAYNARNGHGPVPDPAPAPDPAPVPAQRHFHYV